MSKLEKEHKKKIDEAINRFIDEKRYDEAAVLLVHQAFLEIDPQELVDLLMKAIKEFKAKKEAEKNAAGL